MLKLKSFWKLSFLSSIIFMVGVARADSGQAVQALIRSLEKIEGAELKLNVEKASMARTISASYEVLNSSINYAIKKPDPELLKSIMKVSAKMLANDPARTAGLILLKLFDKYPEECKAALTDSVTQLERRDILDTIKMAQRQAREGNG